MLITDTVQHRLIFNFLPNDKILDWSKFKAFADDKINLAEKLKLVLEWMENSVGKGENAGYQHFLLFPQCFQKPSLSGSLKVGIECERLNPFPSKPWFLRVCSTSLFENTVGKGEIARNEQFLLFPVFFNWRTFCHFYQISYCRLQTLSIWKSLKSDTWERVKVCLSSNA